MVVQKVSAVLVGLLIPFLGTSLGAACVFFLKKDLKISVQRALTGFAAGVMVAASIWSLIVPAIEQCEGRGRWAFLPAFIGFWFGVLFLLLLDEVIPLFGFSRYRGVSTWRLSSYEIYKTWKQRFKRIPDLHGMHGIR